MTTLATGAVDEPDLLTLIADEETPLGKLAADRFKGACEAVADQHEGWVDPNLVRARLLNGDELDIPPRQYAALWSTACAKDGYLDKTNVLVPISGAGSRGNGNKSVPMRRWRGWQEPA